MDRIPVRVFTDYRSVDHWVEIRISKKAGTAGPAGTLYLNCRCEKGQRYWDALREKPSRLGMMCLGMIEIYAQLQKEESNA